MDRLTEAAYGAWLTDKGVEFGSTLADGGEGGLSLPEQLVVSGALDLEEALAPLSGTGVVFLCPACAEFFDVPRPLAAFAADLVCPCGKGRVAPVPGEEEAPESTIAGEGTLVQDPGGPRPEQGASEDTLHGSTLQLERAEARQIGDWFVRARLGEGAAGEVFLVEGATSGKQAALKLRRQGGEAADRRFAREVDLLQRIESEHVVRYLDHGLDLDGSPYVVTSYVAGASLGELLGERNPPRLGIAETLHVLLGACKGLAACHAQGVLHRDVKPSNLIVGIDGGVCLTDYGIALADDVTERLTAQNQILGTPQYVAPEHLSGGEASVASDVYSLGALAWRALVGERPFPGKNVVEVLGAQLEHVPAPVDELRPDVPAELGRLIAKMLAKDPAERPALATLIEFLSETELRPPTSEIAARWKGDLLALAQRTDDRTLASAASVKVGESFLHYRIDRELGRGGMGVVYEAYHLRLRKRVAIKMLLTGALASQRERARFLREAEAVAGLEHPAIVPVLDAGESEGTYYLTMDYVEGQTLNEWAKGQDQTTVLRAFMEVCEGIHHAHSRGVIHRDLKPENVMVDAAGHAHVLDFGIAKTKDESESASLTRDGSVLGTLRYMAPEQARGATREVDTRSDVYALGSVLYELLTGDTPFRGSLHEMLHLVVNTEPPSPRTRRKDLAWELEAITLKAIEKERAARYQSAIALQQDLQRYLAGRPIEARRATLIYRTRKWIGRNRAKAGVALGAAVLLVSLLGLAGRRARLAEVERRDRIVGQVAQAFEHYRLKEFDLAAQGFAVAAQAVTTEDSFPLPLAVATRLPEAVREDLSADERAQPRVQRARLERWADQALEGSRAARVEALIARAGAAVEAEDTGEALLKLRLAEAEAPNDRRLFPVQTRLAARLLSAAEAALAREARLAEEGQNFEPRGEALAQAYQALTSAQSLGSQGASAGLDRFHARRSGLREAIRLREVHQEATERLTKARALREGVGPLGEALPAGLDEARRALHGARRELTVARDRWQDVPGGREELVRLALALGELERKAGRLELAKVELETAALYPELLGAEQEALALALARQDQEARSFERYRKEAEDAFSAGSFAAAAGAYERALTALGRGDQRRDGIKRRRTLADSLAQLEGAERRGDLEDERRLLRIAVELSDEPGELRPRLGRVEATLYARALETAHALSRQARQGASRWQEAIEAYERALAFDPSGSAALRGRADAFAERDCPEDMVLVSVPERLLARGVEAAQVDEAAVLRFYLERCEVSNARYAEFVDGGGYARGELWSAGVDRASLLDTTGRPGPRGWSESRPPAGSEQSAVVGVSAPEAQAYARWRGRRLPSEREWLLAACLDPTSGQLARFPWGEGVPAEELEGLRSLRGVGQRAWDRSPWAASDMGFGVSEWVEASPGEFAVRGLSTHYLQPDLALGVRDWRKEPLASFRHPALGFRCALDVAEAPALSRVGGSQDR